MIRTAVLVSRNGALLQTVLDSMYFKDIPNFELAAVISTRSSAYALQRAKNAGVPCYTVEPSNYPTKLSYSMAISNKLKDMDIDLVIVADYDMPLGVVSTQYRSRIIGVRASLVPAFEDLSVNPVRAALERGCKTTGATVFFYDTDGRIGPIAAQQSVKILSEDNEASLDARIMEEASWVMLPEVLKAYCRGELEIHGNRVVKK